MTPIPPSPVLSRHGRFNSQQPAKLRFTGVNTLTGAVYVSSDTMHLSGNGSISQASAVIVYGTLDAATVTTGNVSFKSLSGTGILALGTNDLTLTSASGNFTGTITGALPAICT